VLAAASPNMIGAVQNLPILNLAQAEVLAEVVPMCELWIRDDLAYPACEKCEHRESDDVHHGALKDHNFTPSGKHEWEWRRMLAMGYKGEHLLWGSLNPLLPQHNPIRQLCLEPVTNYTYGLSPMELMINLQLMGEDLLRKHDQLLDLQIDPPIAVVGLSNVDGERAKLLRIPGGTFTMPNIPHADIKRFAPETPPDAAGMHRLIDEKFDRAGGLPMGAMGANPDPNMRSEGQIMAGAALSSPRTGRRALRVERGLEDVMTDCLRLRRRTQKVELRVPLPQPDPETGKTYRDLLLSQVPGELSVRVSAHSASPLFRNEMREIAALLSERGAISNESFIELVAPPLEDILRPKARLMEKAAAEFKNRALTAKEEESKAKLVAAEAKSRKV
jgi:hypothetical protein